MRQVTWNTGKAFLGRRSKKVGNTETNGTQLRLHGNEIAWRGTYNGYPTFVVTLAGYNTVTTRERVNGVLQLIGSQWRIGTRMDRKLGYTVPYIRNYQTGEQFNIEDSDLLAFDTEGGWLDVKDYRGL